MSKPDSVHLGDGAYATFSEDGLGDTGTVLLTANHHEQRFATDSVYLSRGGLELLVLQARRRGFKFGDDL